MTTSGAQLYEQAENLRIDDPVLWAIVRGKGHIAKIGIASGQPPKVTEERLRELVKAQIITLNEKLGNVYYLNQENDLVKKNLMRLRKFYEVIEHRWVKLTDINVSKVDISANVYRELKGEAPKQLRGLRERFDEDLTMKQAGIMVLVLEMAGESTFRPIDVSRAQGYTQAGYTKNTLMALGNKGLMREVKMYPTTWQLTELGVEKALKAQAAGVKPPRKEEVEVPDL